MNPQNAKIYMSGFIVIGLVSLLSQSVSVPSFLGTEIGVNPFRVLKIIALISFVSAIVTYFKFIKIKKQTLYRFPLPTKVDFRTYRNWGPPI